MNKLLDRSALLQATLLKTTSVPVPELESEILLRELSVAEVGQYSTAGKTLSDEDPTKNSRLAALLVIMSWVDGDGKQVLQPDDVDLVLERLPIRLLNQIGEQAAMLSSLIPQAVEEAKKN